MTTIESKAEVFLMALQALPKAERDAVISRLLDDPKLREDILDIALIRQRRGQPSRPFREYLDEYRAQSRR
ncbi:MAG: hypothetical protein HYY01_03595 [Chloroflexi bacterium]|nr:hypothetical protein [Chloroflexota bacterium]